MAMWLDGDLGTVSVAGAVVGQNVLSICDSSKVESICGGTVEDAELMSTTMLLPSATLRGGPPGKFESILHEVYMGLLTTYDAESGLRSPTITEAQNADKMIVSQELHEMTHMRSELTTYLQPRPRVAKPNIVNDKISFKGPPYKGGGKGQKGGGKSKTKDKGKGKGKTTWVSDIYINGEWKSLCLRYQLGKCSFADCRFVHACAHPKPDGTACGGKHSAMEHSSTPH